MTFKKGDLALLNYDLARGNDELGQDVLVRIHSRKRHGDVSLQVWASDRIGDEMFYDLDVIDPRYPYIDLSPSHWCWEHELKEIVTCPIR